MPRLVFVLSLALLRTSKVNRIWCYCYTIRDERQRACREARIANEWCKVELYDEGVLLGTQMTAPYQFAWDTRRRIYGSHTLTATAYNAAGAAFSQTISVQISNPLIRRPIHQIPKTGVNGPR
jgi:Bacterial Ig domain